MVKALNSNEQATTRVVLSAVFGNGLIAFLKFGAWFLTPNPSMLAEAIHSVADTINQVLLFIGIRHSRSASTREYPWGKQNARYVWNLVSAIGIFFIGFGVTTYHGIHSLLNLHEVPIAGGWTSISVLVVALLIEGRVLFLAVQDVYRKKEDQGFWEFIRYGDDPTPVAVMLEDGVAVLGVLLALLGIWLSTLINSPLPDVIASIIIGVLLGMMAIILALSNGRLLIGASADPAEEEEIRDWLERQPHVERVAALKTEVLGPAQIRLVVEVEFLGEQLIDQDQISKDVEKIRDGEEPFPILVDTAERMVRIMGKEINELERRMKKEFPQITVIDMEVN